MSGTSVVLTVDEARELCRVLVSEPETLADPTCDEEERAGARALIDKEVAMLEERIAAARDKDPERSGS